LAFRGNTWNHLREGIVTKSFDNSPSEVESCGRSIEQQAQALLCQHPHFRGREVNFAYEYREDVLIVRGRVPTYYLKQVLQTVLKEVSGVTHIDNRVNVISSDGVG
jgi:hypothetical protein